MMSKSLTVFISHSLQDTDIADYLTRELKASGVQVWYDKPIKPGSEWVKEIEEALEQAEIFVVLLSPNFLASPWANFELGVALSRAEGSRKVRVIPILTRGIDLDQLPRRLRQLQAIEMEGIGIAEASRQVARIATEATKDNSENDET
jgi:hypothetical protein